MRDPVIIGIATFDGPGRKESLRETKRSLKGQADLIMVATNDMFGDAMKFDPFFDLKVQCYCLTCDDDLIYPPDCVERMIEGIESYNRKAVCSFHGKAWTGKADVWYMADGPRYPCLRSVSSDQRITIPGTGVMGWHSSLLDISLDDFPEPNMADIWMGKKLNEMGIPRYVLAHEEGWIKHTDKIDMDETLWRVNKRDSDKTNYITEVFNSVEWKL